MSRQICTLCIPLNPEEIVTAQQKRAVARFDKRISRYRAFIYRGKRLDESHSRIIGALSYAWESGLISIPDGWDASVRRPLLMSGVIVYALPKSYPASRYGTMKYTKPDTDNVLKPLQDGVTESGHIWVDDAQVSYGTMVKRYQLGPYEQPHITLFVEDATGIEIREEQILEGIKNGIHDSID